MSDSEELLNNALSGAAREIGNSVTPNDLKQQGVRRLRYVPREKMAALLERAVERILEQRKAADGEASMLVSDVQTGLLGLLRGARDVETARRDIAEQRESLQNDLDAIHRDRNSLGLDGRSRVLGSGDEDGSLDRDRTIDRLERRVAKLIASLQDTELALQRALVTANLDTGIASLHRVVQGLAPNDPQAEQKQAMMHEIFRANMDLRAAFEGA